MAAKANAVRSLLNLEKQLSKFPAELLDRQCFETHLGKLVHHITTDAMVMMAADLGLSDAEVEDIQTAWPRNPVKQRLEIFKKWQEKEQSEATYRCLITIIHGAGRMNFIDEMQRIVAVQQIPMHQPQLDSHNLDWYGGYLKKRYLEVLFALQVSANERLPSPTQKIFNLAIIRKEKTRSHHEFVHKIIRGQVDDILLENTPIEVKNLFQNIEGERKVILINGAPGSGKSTLTVHICQQWAKGELFNQFTIVILVQLRDPRVQNAQSIAELLPCEDRVMAERAAREIMAVKGSGVLWILDGWDELPSTAQNESIISTLIKPRFHQENPLSRTAVIVTSRPISSGDLCPLVSLQVEVLGFTAEEQRLFFTECLNNDTKAVETLMERLSNNPAMEGCCYLPLNASIVAHLYLTNGSLPSTVYGIFSSLVQHYLSRYLHDRQGISLELASFESLEGLPDKLQTSFKQLCKLAFIGARDNKITFYTSDIKALGAPKEICELGLLQSVPRRQKFYGSTLIIVYHNFLHSSIHAMLAALHISGMPAREQVSIFDSMFNKARFSAVLQFYAAITKLCTSRPLLSLVPRFLRPVPASIYDVIRKLIQQPPRHLLVLLFNCLYEAQDTALCKFVEEQLRGRIYLPYVSLLPQDCLSIGYFLGSIVVGYKGEFGVYLGGSSLGDTHIKILMQSLCRNLDLRSEIIGHLDVSLHHKRITEEGASYIAEVLGTTRVLRKLSLWDNPISDKGLQCIAEALTTNTSLIQLSLFGCSLRITEENGPSLTEMLQRNRSLKKFHLSGNPISDKGLQCIAEALTTNTSLIELCLSRCSLKITEENGPTLTKMLQRNKTLSKLYLTGNGAISDNQASFIIEGLKKNTTLKTLNLTSCGITDEGIRLIKSSTSTCKIIKSTRYW